MCGIKNIMARASAPSSLNSLEHEKIKSSNHGDIISSFILFCWECGNHYMSKININYGKTIPYHIQVTK